MDCPDDVIPEAAQYIKVYLAGTVITIIYNISAGMIRSEGDSTRPLIYLVISGVSNLFLDLLFVAVFKWGVASAAAATVRTSVRFHCVKRGKEGGRYALNAYKGVVSRETCRAF